MSFVDEYFTAFFLTFCVLVVLAFATWLGGCQEETRLEAVERVCRHHGGVRNWEGGDIGSYAGACIDGTPFGGFTREEGWQWPWW